MSTQSLNNLFIKIQGKTNCIQINESTTWADVYSELQNKNNHIDLNNTYLFAGNYCINYNNLKNITSTPHSLNLSSYNLMKCFKGNCNRCGNTVCN